MSRTRTANSTCSIVRNLYKPDDRKIEYTTKITVGTTGNGRSWVNPMTGQFTIRVRDYESEFEDKRQALHDIIRDGDGLRKDEVADLVLTAQRAIHQNGTDN